MEEEHNLTSDTCRGTPALLGMCIRCKEGGRHWRNVEKWMCDNCMSRKDTEHDASMSCIEDNEQSQASTSDSVHPEYGVGEFLKTLEFLIKPKQRKRHKFGEEPKPKCRSYKSYVIEEWPGRVTCCGKIFESGWSLKYHIEKNHIKSRRYRLG